MEKRFFTKKELTWMLITIIILAFIIGIISDPSKNTARIEIITPLIASTLIIFTTVITKKIAAPHFNIRIEHRSWEFQRYGYYTRSYFRRPIPIGLLFPFFITLLSLGYIKPMTLLQFDVQDIPETRILKKRGNRRALRKQEMNDSDPGFTAAWGFYALLALAVIGIIIKLITGFSLFSQIARYSIFYGIWNLVPISQLDGSKLFFGSILSWVFIAILHIILLLFVLVI